MKQKKTTHSKLSTELAFSFQKKGREKMQKLLQLPVFLINKIGSIFFSNPFELIKNYLKRGETK